MLPELPQQGITRMCVLESVVPHFTVGWVTLVLTHDYACLQVPSLYRSELHVPELFDLFFGRDISDLMMSLIGLCHHGSHLWWLTSAFPPHRLRRAALVSQLHSPSQAPSFRPAHCGLASGCSPQRCWPAQRGGHGRPPPQLWV